eukprot:107203_1
MKCSQLNISQTTTYTVTEDKNSIGWDKYCLINPFIESDPLDIICDIQIIELNNNPLPEVIDSKLINNEMKEEINNKENTINKYEQIIHTLQNEKQSIKNKLDEITQIQNIKETGILSLQKENETLRNNRDQTQQMNSKQQTQFN